MTVVSLSFVVVGFIDIDCLPDIFVVVRVFLIFMFVYFVFLILSFFITICVQISIVPVMHIQKVSW